MILAHRLGVPNRGTRQAVAGAYGVEIGDGDVFTRRSAEVFGGTGRRTDV